MKSFVSKRLLALAAVSGTALTLAAGAFGQAAIMESHEALPDFDARTGSVAPSSAQLALVSALGAEARWNRFGTPQSLVKHGGYLASGISGNTAVAAARSWLETNKALFRLASVDELTLVTDGRLVGSDGYAVSFRQVFGDLETIEDGLVTVGIEGSAASGWKVAYASSSLTGDAALSGTAGITAQEAWIRAAANVGRGLSVLDTRAGKEVGGWAVFAVNGFDQPQRARLRALPTPKDGVVPVYETIFLEGTAAPAAYKHYVDARDGTVLFRHNLVEQSHADAVPFSGTLSGADGECSIDHGPYNAPAGTFSIDVSATFDVVANDIVLRLKRDGTIVQAADTLFSPEAIHYEPTGGVPPGDYFVQVCEFADGEPAVVSPATYRGTISVNHTAGASPFPYPPKWKVFPAYPLLNTLDTDPWNNPSTDIREVWCWDANVEGNPVAGCDREVGNLASRAPWDHVIATDSPSFTTVGNNAHSQESWESPFTPDATPYRPTSSDREYIFPWTNQWFASDCNYSAIVATGNDIDPAVTNLFAMHNRMHDWAYFLGFTEEHWNAQDHNFGLTPRGRQNDALLGDAQAGALTGPPPLALGRDNANMISLPDGVHPITNMYLWQPIAAAFYPPCVDGDFDMAVIGHEYGHLIENRMIGKGGTRTGHHAGAMGEANGDLLGMEVLNEYGFVPVAGENRYAVGAYATGEKQRGIRNYAMNWPSSGAAPAPSSFPQVNPLNFGNMGYDLTGPQVHADGEIWTATNFDIRQALNAKYDTAFPSSDVTLQRNCAEGRIAADRCPGNRRWMQLVYDAYLLMPVGPSMLDARDAYLAADQMRFGGANQAELWLAFARRGFGPNATSSNSNANTDTDPTPDFSSPLHANATVTFAAIARDEGNAPITNARVYVGHYEARTSPIADTDPATSGANLDATASVAPGTYEFIAHAPGYGHVRFRQTVAAGATVPVRIATATNWASISKGGSASGDGDRLDDLIDDTEATNWERTGEPAPGAQVTVDLAGVEARTVTRVQVSAMLRPPEEDEASQNRFTALRQFRIETSTDGATFTPAYTSPEDAFPADAPRPVAPAIILREFDIPDTQATHVRLVVVHNQCTGGPDFQGDQDAGDPLNNPDCDDGSTRDNQVRAAELQVFGSASAVTPGAGGAAGPPAGVPPGPPPGVQQTGPCTITGTEGNDTLRGTPGPDVICALGGNDVVYAGRGNDIVRAGRGRDIVYGGRGADRLFGNAGPDWLRGQGGRDRLVGGRDRDRLSGGAGRDTLNGHELPVRRDVLNGGPGVDRCRANRPDVRRAC